MGEHRIQTTAAAAATERDQFSIFRHRRLRAMLPNAAGKAKKRVQHEPFFLFVKWLICLRAALLPVWKEQQCAVVPVNVVLSAGAAGEQERC